MLPPKILGFVFAVAAFGCSHRGVVTERMPDGSIAFKCSDEPLWVCLSHVDEVCKGRAYEVVGGWSKPIPVGVENTRVESHRSEALVRCLGPWKEPPKMTAKPVQAPVVAHVVPGKSKASPPPAPVAPPPRVCVPGTTQSCVGSAACAGGQACLADGSAFGPCDCGSR